MTLHSWFLYLTLAVMAAATPGPAILLITTNSALYGCRKAVLTALGNISGLFCMGIITITGLGMVLSTSLVIFDLMRYLGAAYLIFLGFRLLRQKSGGFSKQRDERGVVDISGGRLYLQGFGVALSNPKAILFLTALFPQFVSVDEPLMVQFAILIATLMVVSFSFLMLYALLARQAQGWLNTPGNRRRLSRTSGVFFVGIGCLLASSGR